MTVHDRSQGLEERLAAAVEELERYRFSVMQLNQLRNDLIAVLAHDIKGPLTSIVGFAELLEEGFLEGEGAVDAARTIRTNAQRLATLANDVLALTRVEHGELEIADDRVDVIDVAKAAIELHAAERAINFTTDLTSAHVRGDADRLRQVFDNLLRNAIKYSPGGEAVDVTVSAEGDRVRIAFRDHGIGIPSEDIPKLFDRFSRATNARRAKIPGTGVGLFICKMIVERHGGEIVLQTALGEGSTFVVMLPAAEAAAPRTPRVTIVTGDRALSRFSAYELRARGYRVREVATAAEAAADLHSGDIVIVDAAVASVDDIRALLRSDIRVRYIGVGADGDEWDVVLAKPFLVNDLVRALG
jgi:signal transduction histidine kinase